MTEEEIELFLDKEEEWWGHLPTAERLILSQYPNHMRQRIRLQSEERGDE